MPMLGWATFFRLTCQMTFGGWSTVAEVVDFIVFLLWSRRSSHAAPINRRRYFLISLFIRDPTIAFTCDGETHRWRPCHPDRRAWWRRGCSDSDRWSSYISSFEEDSDKNIGPRVSIEVEDYSSKSKTKTSFSGKSSFLSNIPYSSLFRRS